MTSVKSIANELNLVVQHARALIQSEEVLKVQNNDIFLSNVRNSEDQNKQMTSARDYVLSCTSSVTASSFSDYNTVNSSTTQRSVAANSQIIESSSNKRVKVSNGSTTKVLSYERRCAMRQVERLLQDIDKQIEEGIGVWMHSKDVLGNLVTILTDILPHWLIAASNEASPPAREIHQDFIDPILQRCVNITQICAKLVLYYIHPFTPAANHNVIRLVNNSVLHLCNSIRRRASIGNSQVVQISLSPTEEIQRESLLHLVTHLITILNTAVMLESSSSRNGDDDAKELHDDDDPSVFQNIRSEKQQVLPFPMLNCRQTIETVVSLLYIFLENISNLSDNQNDSSLFPSLLSKHVVHFQFSILIGDLFAQLSSIAKVFISRNEQRLGNKKLSTNVLLSEVFENCSIRSGSFEEDELIIEDFVELANLFVSQTLEYAIDSINVLQTRWKRIPMETICDISEEEQPLIDDLLHHFQLVTQSIALSVNLIETITSDQDMLQIHISQHLLFSFFHAFATFYASGACHDLVKIEGPGRQLMTTDDHDTDRGRSEKVDLEFTDKDDISFCSTSSLESVTDTASVEINDTLGSLQSTLVRLLKIVSSSPDLDDTRKNNAHIHDISFKRKKLALELAFLSTFDSSSVVSEELLEFMLSNSRCDGDRILEDLNRDDSIHRYTANIELYETSKLLQAALISSIMMASVKTTTHENCARAVTSLLLPEEETPGKHLLIVKALFSSQSNSNPWNWFLARKLPDTLAMTAKEEIDFSNYCYPAQTCFDTLAN